MRPEYWQFVNLCSSGPLLFPFAFFLTTLPFISAALRPSSQSVSRHSPALAVVCMPELVAGAGDVLKVIYWGHGRNKRGLVCCIFINSGRLACYLISLFLPDIKILPVLTILRYTRNNTSDPGSSLQIAVFIKIFGAALKRLF